MILHAPTPLGLKPPAPGRVPGVRHMPHALRAAGLHDALDARFAGEVSPGPYVADIDPELHVRNPHAIASYSVALADALGALLDADAFPLVLGGDCSITIGTALALRRRGRFGVVYIDAHSDCQTPTTSRTGGVAGMPLAIATGRGPELLTDLEGRGPYIAEGDAMLVGVSDLFDVVGDTEKRVAETGIRVHDLEAVRATGALAVAQSTLAHLAHAGVDGVWIHVDADVLDRTIMPAVDSPEPEGLSAAELSDVLASLLGDPLVVGLQATIYDPERDPDGGAGRAFANILAHPFRVR